MRKIGYLEILIIVTILITSGALIYKFVNSSSKNDNSYEFDGDQMYKCTWVAENIMKKNFPLYAYIEGKWTSSNKDFNDIVLITNARGGTLTAQYNNDKITIGGEMAYTEDIAAKKIILKPLGNSIIEYTINPIAGSSFKDIKNKIENTEPNYSNENIKILQKDILGTIAIDSKTFSPSEQQSIKNKLSFELDNKNNGLFTYFVPNGMFISGKMNINTLDKLSTVVQPYNISTSQLKIYIIVNETANNLPKSITENNNLKIIKLK